MFFHFCLVSVIFSGPPLIEMKFAMNFFHSIIRMIIVEWKINRPGSARTATCRTSLIIKVQEIILTKKHQNSITCYLACMMPLYCAVGYTAVTVTHVCSTCMQHMYVHACVCSFGK